MHIFFLPFFCCKCLQQIIRTAGQKLGPNVKHSQSPTDSHDCPFQELVPRIIPKVIFSTG